MSFRRTSANALRLRNAKLALNATFSAGAATSISVADVVDKDGRIMQRDPGLTAKTVTVTVDYTGPASLIEYRIVRASNGAALTEWATLSSNPTGGQVVAAVAIAQGLYQKKIAVRCGVNTTVTATTSRKFAVGVLVVLPGQSNMRFLSEAITGLYPLASLDNRRYRAANHDWQHHGNYDATGTFPPGATVSTYGATRTDVAPDRGDGIVAFTIALANALGCAVGTLEVSVSGTSMATWLPGSGSNWGNLETALAEAGGDAELWLHLQGENDASAATTGVTWQAGSQAMHDRAKVLTGRTSAQLHWGTGLLGTASTYATEGRFGVIRAAQLGFIAANASAFCMGSFIEAPISDSVHYAPGYRARQGRVMAYTAAAKLAGSPKSGPKITGASKSGATAVVTFAGHVGALKDGAGGNGASLGGFRFYDNGVLMTITSTLISGNDVLVGFSAAPAGTVTFDYGMANAPYGTTPAAASVLYDSSVIPGDTLGLSAQPRALATVS